MEKTLESFVDMLEENSNADVVKTEQGKTILLVKHVEESIKAQVKEPGEGSIFAKAWKLEELKSSLQKINPIEGKEIYEGQLNGAGYNLIAERKDVVPFKKLVGYSEEKKLVESASVKIAHIPQYIDKFKTDTITYKIRKVEVEEAITDFSQYENDAREGKLYILEDVKIGPYLEKLAENHYIVIPKK